MPGIDDADLNVGLIEGGTNTNVVPDKVTFRLDRRMIPEEIPAEVEAGLRELIDDSARPFAGIKVDDAAGAAGDAAGAAAGHRADRVGDPAPRAGDPRHGRARHRRAALHRRPPLRRARHSGGALRRGPRTMLEANAHNANENIRLSDLRAATKIIALTVASLCAGLSRGLRLS